MKKLSATGLLIGLLVPFLVQAQSVDTQAQTQCADAHAQIQALLLQVDQLNAKVALLQSQLAASSTTTGNTAMPSWCSIASFQALAYGSSGPTVYQLQQAMGADSGITPSGHYGPRTRSYWKRKCSLVSGTSSTAAISISSFSGPTSVTVGQSGTWAVTATDTNALPLSYSIQWGDERNYDRLSSLAGYNVFSSNTTFSHSYRKAGSYVIQLLVRDSSGQAAIASTSVSVTNTSTTASTSVSTLNASVTSGLAPLSVTFTGDTGAGCHKGDYQLFYGDTVGGGGDPIHSTESLCNGTFTKTHTYQTPGTYTASLMSGSCNPSIPSFAGGSSCNTQTLASKQITVTSLQTSTSSTTDSIYSSCITPKGTTYSSGTTIPFTSNEWCTYSKPCPYFIPKNEMCLDGEWYASY